MLVHYNEFGPTEDMPINIRGRVPQNTPKYSFPRKFDLDYGISLGTLRGPVISLLNDLCLRDASESVL